MPANPDKSPEERKTAAKQRTPEQQLRRLDARPGDAKKERSKLAARIAIQKTKDRK